MIFILIFSNLCKSPLFNWTNKYGNRRTLILIRHMLINSVCDFTQLPTTSQLRDYRQQQRNFDPSTQHLVDPVALSRLQVEPDQDDTLDPTLTDSYSSSADTQGRRFIKRIVLR